MCLVAKNSEKLIKSDNFGVKSYSSLHLVRRIPKNWDIPQVLLLLLDERLAGMQQESSECKEQKRKQQISPPKKFYLAEHLLKNKVLPNNYM